MIILDDIEDSENNWQRFLKKRKKNDNKNEDEEDVPSPSAAGRKNSDSSVEGKTLFMKANQCKSFR